MKPTVPCTSCRHPQPHLLLPGPPLSLCSGRAGSLLVLRCSNLRAIITAVPSASNVLPPGITMAYLYLFYVFFQRHLLRKLFPHYLTKHHVAPLLWHSFCNLTYLLLSTATRTKLCYWVQACSAHRRIGQWIWEMRCWGKGDTFIREPADLEDGRLVPQNNHCIGGLDARFFYRLEMKEGEKAK